MVLRALFVSFSSAPLFLALRCGLVHVALFQGPRWGLPTLAPRSWSCPPSARSCKCGDLFLRVGQRWKVVTQSSHIVCIRVRAAHRIVHVAHPPLWTRQSGERGGELARLARLYLSALIDDYVITRRYSVTFTLSWYTVQRFIMNHLCTSTTTSTYVCRQDRHPRMPSSYRPKLVNTVRICWFVICTLCSNDSNTMVKYEWRNE